MSKMSGNLAAHSCYCNFHNHLTPFSSFFKIWFTVSNIFLTHLWQGSLYLQCFFLHSLPMIRFIIGNHACKRNILFFAELLYIPRMFRTYIPFIDTDCQTCLKGSGGFTSRFKSLIPDWLGSATISTRSIPLTDAITGHPMPGDPSIMASSVSGACFSMAIFTSVTSFPEFPRPIFKTAVENILSPRYSSFLPATSSARYTAFWGHT